MGIISKVIIVTLIAKGLSAETSEAPKEMPKAEANDQKPNNTVLIEFKNYVDGYSEVESDEKIRIQTAYAIDYADAIKKLPGACYKEYKHTLLLDHETSFTLILEPHDEDVIIFYTITSQDVKKEDFKRFIFQLSASALHTTLYKHLDFLKKRLHEQDKVPLPLGKYQEIFFQAINREIGALKKIISD